jgi:hypothetical protein
MCQSSDRREQSTHDQGYGQENSDVRFVSVSSRSEQKVRFSARKSLARAKVLLGLFH